MRVEEGKTVGARRGTGERERECWGIGRGDKMWQWAHWLAGRLLLYTPITQSLCPPRHFNLIPRPKETKAQYSTTQRKAGALRREILFTTFSFHLCEWIFNFITKMAAPLLIALYLICWMRVDAVWMDGSSWSGFAWTLCTCVHELASARHYFWLD